MGDHAPDGKPVGFSLRWAELEDEPGGDAGAAGAGAAAGYDTAAGSGGPGAAGPIADSEIARAAWESDRLDSVSGAIVPCGAAAWGDASQPDVGSLAVVPSDGAWEGAELDSVSGAIVPSDAAWGRPLPAGAVSESSKLWPALIAGADEDKWDPTINSLIDNAAKKYLSGLARGGGSSTNAALEQPLDPGLLGEAITRDPKRALNELCQKACRRPISKQDVVYTGAPRGRGAWQVNLSVNCLGGQEFRGEICYDRRDAEKSAAEQALHFYAKDPATRPILLSCSGAGTAAVAVAAGGPAAASAAVPPLLRGQALAPSAVPPLDKGSLPEELAGQNYKLALNTVLGRLMKSSLQRDSAVYQVVAVRGGFQVALRLPCLPGEWGHQAWVGQVCPKRKDAEASAAGAALSAILMDPELGTRFRMSRPSSKWIPGKGGIRAQQEKLTGVAPKVYLAVACDGRNLGSVEVSPGTSLASVRVLIRDRRMGGVPADYLFLNDSIPIPKDTEGVQLARDYLPQITIVNEDLRGSARRRQTASASQRSPRAGRRPAASHRDGDRGGGPRGRSRSPRGAGGRAPPRPQGRLAIEDAPRRHRRSESRGAREPRGRQHGSGRGFAPSRDAYASRSCQLRSAR